MRVQNMRLVKQINKFVTQKSFGATKNRTIQLLHNR